MWSVHPLYMYTIHSFKWALEKCTACLDLNSLQFCPKLPSVDVEVQSYAVLVHKLLKFVSEHVGELP